MIGALLAIVFIAVVAVNFRGGLWTNALRLVCVISGALCATNFFEPLANAMERSLASLFYFADFIAVWGVFGVVTGGLTYLTGRCSLTNVRFPKVLDQLGGVGFSVLTGWTLLCFTTMTLHLAPLPREPFGGAFVAEEPSFYGMYPDRMWLAFAQHVSRGAYARGTSHTFDGSGDFLIRAAAKRHRFEKAKSSFSPRIVIGETR